MTVRAPGKAFISGEYAVLGGAPAVVAAVSCHARARLQQGAAPALTPFLRELCARLAPPAGTWPVVDTTPLYDAKGQKLGLGASAAATVAAGGAVLAAAGRDLRAPAERAALLMTAVQAHRAAQAGRGSGADVAAAVHGGLVRVVRRVAWEPGGLGPPGSIAGGHGNPSRVPISADVLEVTPVALPEGYALLLFRLGGPASTTALLARVEALEAAAPERYDELMGVLRAAAESFAGDPIASMRVQRRALAALGEAAGAPIVPPACHVLADAAEALGGAAKTSGAGGGDLGVALVPAARAADLARAAGASPLRLQIDWDGVTLEPDDGGTDGH